LNEKVRAVFAASVALKCIFRSGISQPP